MTSAESSQPSPSTQARFDATRWTIVLQARSPDSREALNQLCRIYWPPIYALIRRQGFVPADAADLTQDFFVHILEHEVLSAVAREKGKFRSFLQKSLANFLHNERDRLGAKKRGGDKFFVSIDTEAEEGRHPMDETAACDSAKLFDRRWALAVIDEVTAKLKNKNSAGEKGATFAELQPYLTGDTAEGVYTTLAARLNMSEGAVKTALHRLRREFGELLRSEIRHTLSDPTEQDIKEEIRHLFAALSE